MKRPTDTQVFSIKMCKWCLMSEYFTKFMPNLHSGVMISHHTRHVGSCLRHTYAYSGQHRPTPEARVIIQNEPKIKKVTTKLRALLYPQLAKIRRRWLATALRVALDAHPPTSDTYTFFKRSSSGSPMFKNPMVSP